MFDAELSFSSIGCYNKVKDSGLPYLLIARLDSYISQCISAILDAKRLIYDLNSGLRVCFLRQ